MKVYNIHEAKTHLSRLIDEAAEGEPFIIAKSGRPMVKVVAVDPSGADRRRLDFLEGVSVPDDFDRMEADAIASLFERGA